MHCDLINRRKKKRDTENKFFFNNCKYLKIKIILLKGHTTNDFLKNTQPAPTRRKEN